MNLQFELVNEDSLKDFLEIYDIDNHINSNYDKAKLRLKELLPTEFHYTVKNNSYIVGIFSLTLHGDIVEESKKYLTIWNLHVRKEFRRKKIGTNILEFVRIFAEENDCDFINLAVEKENISAMQFYESLDYQKNYSYTLKIGETL